MGKLRKPGFSIKVGLIVSIAALMFALAAASAGASGASGKSGFFKTQNNRIYCGWGTGSQGFVVCGIKNGFLKPKPKNTCTHVDYVGNRIAFNVTGKAKIQRCAGDAGPFADPKATKVLKAGRTWKGGGMSCKALTRSSVKCKNKSHHGFTMKTNGSYKLF